MVNLYSPRKELYRILKRDCLCPSVHIRGGEEAADGISKGYYGLDQGPIVLMIENYRSGFLWRLMRGCPYIVSGLRRAGFSGGWLRGSE
jgi:hypothetical protein